MREFLFEWIKNLAVYYLIGSTLMHLSPNEKYTRYFRYLMGLFLISMLCIPVFTLAGKDVNLVENLERYLKETEEREKILWEELQEKEKKFLEGLEEAYGTNREQSFYSSKKNGDETMDDISYTGDFADNNCVTGKENQSVVQ